MVNPNGNGYTERSTMNSTTPNLCINVDTLHTQRASEMSLAALALAAYHIGANTEVGAKFSRKFSDSVILEASRRLEWDRVHNTPVVSSHTDVDNKCLPVELSFYGE